MTREMKDRAEQLFYLVSCFSILVGGILWLTTMDFQAKANSQDIQVIKGKQDETAREFEEIRVRLAHIEDAVSSK